MRTKNMAKSPENMSNEPNKRKVEKKPFERPSDRMFRRSQAAERRRRKAERADTNFMRVVFGIAGVTTLIVFMIVYMLSAGVQ